MTEPEAVSDSPSSRISWWFLLLVIWTVPGGLSAVQENLYLELRTEAEVSSLSLAVRTLPTWWPWILGTPVVIALGRRLRSRSRLARGTGHLVAAAILGAAHLFWLAAFRTWFPILYDFSLAVRWEQLLWSLHPFMELIAYGVVLMASRLHDTRREMDQRRLQFSQLREEMAVAGVQALRMQLQPHFLFNTLNSISVLVKDNPDGARAMIQGLSALLRDTLDSMDQEERTLEEEIDGFQTYWDLMKIRYPQLSCSVDVPSDVQNLDVPVMLLQPLAENVVRHGLPTREEPVRLTLRAEASDEKLRLTMSDDGTGLVGGWKEGVGLRNTRSRLKSLYGEDAVLSVAPRLPRGTTVQIEIPREIAG